MLPACCIITAYMRAALSFIFLTALGFLQLLHPTQTKPSPASPTQAAAVVAAANGTRVPLSAASREISSPSSSATSHILPQTDVPPSNTTITVHTTALTPRGQVLGTSTETTYVTQDELAAEIQQATNALRSLIYQNESAPNSVPASGGYTNEIALSNDIDNLSGGSNGPLTISNATLSNISGLTAAEIPDLSSTYLTRAGGTNDIDVFLIAGQSNAEGYDNTTSGPTTTPGTAYQYYSSIRSVPQDTFTNIITNGVISPANDPVGNASTGSAWPQFAITYYNMTGHKVAFVPAAVGATSLIASDPNTWGNWSPTGKLFGNSVADANAAMAAFQAAGYNPHFVGVLWDQGESDAHTGNGPAYESALQTLIANYGAQFGANIPFYIFRTGTVVGANDEPYAEIRNAQEAAATANPNTFVVFRNAVDFPARGLMGLSGHYSQAGYNEMGNIGAEAIANRTSGPYWAQQSNNLVLASTTSSVGIGTTTPWAALSITSSGQQRGSASLFSVASTTGTSLFTILGSGNVGIGTSSPFALLSVAGDGFFNGNLTASGLTVSGNTLLNQATTTSIFSTTASSTSLFTSNLSIANLSGLLKATNGAVTTALAGTDYVTPAGDLANIASAYPFQLARNATSTLTQFNGGLTAYATSTIGAGGQATGLTISGGATTTGNAYFAGNVGIGTTSPQTLLGLQGGIGVNSSQLYLAANGNVGIGTTTPSGRLSVTGPDTGTGAAFQIANSAGSTTLTVQDNGTLLIGTTTDSNNGAFPGALIVNSSTSLALFRLLGSNVLLPNALDLGSDVTSSFYRFQQDERNLLEASGADDFNIWYQSTTTALTRRFAIKSNGTVYVPGNMGVGTFNPYSRLQVSGPDAASSTSAFAVVNSASTTVFAVFDGGNAQLSGTLTQSSDQRLKTNIQSLDTSDTLTLIDQLNPVTFNWIDPSQGSNTQVGFIAQQLQAIFPELVSTTSATALTPGGTLGLNYIGLIAPAVSAIQALSSEVENLIAEVQGFAQSFVSDNITVNNTLCIKDSDGTPVCITGDQLAALLAGQSTPSSSYERSAPASTTTPPTITIMGNNPAIIEVGESYSDLGATANDSAGNDLGIKYFLNGALVSNIVLDTSKVATDTIDYVATDTYGNTATSTRTVIVEAMPISVTASDATTSATSGTTSQ